MLYICFLESKLCLAFLMLMNRAVASFLILQLLILFLVPFSLSSLLSSLNFMKGVAM